MDPAERAQLDEDVKTERLHRLQDRITHHQRAIQDAMVGRTVGVLFEKPGRLPGQMVGKSDYLHAVHVAECNLKPGDLARVEITESGSNSLAGRLVG